MNLHFTTRTTSQKPADVTRQWYLIDAADVPLGRLATKVADLIHGKGKVTFTKHTDGGDFVIVINADKVYLSGRKEEQKKYYSHSGYPGSIKEINVADQRTKDATKLIQKAVYGMIPKNKLRDDRMNRLKIYNGPEHAHEAQKPTKIEAK